MEWAHEAVNHVLVSYLLMRKSHQARDLRDAERVIALAQAAQQVGDPLPPRVRALAVQEEAQGHALAGNEVSCHRKFDEALELVACSHREGLPAPGQGRYCTEVYIELQRANGWIELGHPRRAIDLYESQLAKLPAVQQRDCGVYKARQALAYVAAGDPEQAVAVGYTTLVIGRETDSARIFTELHRLGASLADWVDPPGAQLAEVARSLAQPVGVDVVAVAVALDLLGGGPPRPAPPHTVRDRAQQAGQPFGHVRRACCRLGAGPPAQLSDNQSPVGLDQVQVSPP